MTVPDAVCRLMLAPNGGAIVGAVFDLCRELGLPEPNRNHLAGIVRRYGKTENARRRIWIALAESLGEHISQRDAGGIGSVTQYLDRVIAMSGVAPAARDGASRPQYVDDAVQALVKLGWNVSIAEQVVLKLAPDCDDAVELVRRALQAEGTVEP